MLQEGARASPDRHWLGVNPPHSRNPRLRCCRMKSPGPFGPGLRYLRESIQESARKSARTGVRVEVHVEVPGIFQEFGHRVGVRGEVTIGGIEVTNLRKA